MDAVYTECMHVNGESGNLRDACKSFKSGELFDMQMQTVSYKCNGVTSNWLATEALQWVISSNVYGINLYATLLGLVSVKTCTCVRFFLRFNFVY